MKLKFQHKFCYLRVSVYCSKSSTKKSKSSRSQVFCKKLVLKKRLWRRRFPVNCGIYQNSVFSKHFRAPVFNTYLVAGIDIIILQAINFYFVPTQLRMAYINFVTLCFNTFLSYIKHKVRKVLFSFKICKNLIDFNPFGKSIECDSALFCRNISQKFVVKTRRKIEPGHQIVEKTTFSGDKELEESLQSLK